MEKASINKNKEEKPIYDYILYRLYDFAPYKYIVELTLQHWDELEIWQIDKILSATGYMMKKDNIK